MADVKVKRTIRIFIDLEETESKDLEMILNRINMSKTIGKSEFSLREKALARKLEDLLEEANGG